MKRITLEGNTQNEGMEKKNYPVLASPQLRGRCGRERSEVELGSKGKDRFFNFCLSLLLPISYTHIYVVRGNTLISPEVCLFSL